MVVEDDTLANITARSIIAGFVRPGQHERCSVSAKYSARSPGCGSGGRSGSRSRVVLGLYPSWEIRQAGLGLS